MARHFLELEGAETVDTEPFLLARRAIVDLYEASAMGAIHGEPGVGVADRVIDVVSVAEAVRVLGVGRARVYQLLDAGVLEAVDTEPLQITLRSVQRRLQGVRPVGAQLASLSAWAVLAG